MRPLAIVLTLGFLALLTACSSPDSRIADHRAAFDKFPVDVQQKIRAGQVEVGFTPEMVRMALGEPARIFTRRTETGDTEIWGYHDNHPQFSFGFGVGTGGRHSAVGGGMEMSTGGDDPEEKMRVRFREGRVSEVDYVRR